MSDSGQYRVTLADVDGEVVVLVAGEIDLTAQERLCEVIEEARARQQRLVVDLSKTSFIDSSGIRVLVQAWRAQCEAGLETLLRRPSRQVLRALEVFGLVGVISIERAPGTGRRRGR